MDPSQIKPFLPASSKPSRAAIFLSGSGSNAERILDRVKAHADAPLEVVVLVTDRPERSRAREIAAAYDLPVVANDIREFYQARGCKRVSIATPEGRALREQWTDALRRQLSLHDIDFGIFAGFVPLTNLTGDFPCLNVHPGDLTYLKDGERYLVGLHTVPIERAILDGLDHLRTSVIIAEPYGNSSDMDSGPILGLSPAVPIDLQGRPLAELTAIAARRPEKRPPGGYKDELESIAAANQDLLKEGGDWVVFPPAVLEFAANRFGTLNDQLCYQGQPVQTVEYDVDSATPRV